MNLSIYGQETKRTLESKVRSFEAMWGKTPNTVHLGELAYEELYVYLRHYTSYDVKLNKSLHLYGVEVTNQYKTDQDPNWKPKPVDVRDTTVMYLQPKVNNGGWNESNKNRKRSSGRRPKYATEH